MKTINFGDIEIEYDFSNNQKFYATQYGFGCDCQDCLNYIDKFPIVKSLLKGLDEQIGIDITKDVGQGMDELMPVDYDDHNLYVIPYYINGLCRVNKIELTKAQSGPVMKNTVRAKYKLDDNLTLTIINTTDSIKFKDAKSVLTIWFEFKTPLIKHNSIKVKEDNKKEKVTATDVEKEIDKAVKTTFFNKLKKYFSR